jgi:predicted DNA-binding protein with PD1-like motif
MFKKVHIFRVKPGQKLNHEVLDYCQKNNITSGIILSLLGSLNNVELGFLKELPGKYIAKKFSGPLEIVSGTGSIAKKDREIITHIHLTISDEIKAVGGHLIEGEIFSTAEVVIGEIEDQIERYMDHYTGLNELKD